VRPVIVKQPDDPGVIPANQLGGAEGKRARHGTHGRTPPDRSGAVRCAIAARTVPRPASSDRRLRLGSGLALTYADARPDPRKGLIQGAFHPPERGQVLR